MAEEQKKSKHADKFGSDCIEHWHDRKRWCGLPLSFTRYAIIEKPGKWIKLISEVGFLSTHVEETQLFRVDDSSIFQSFTNSLFGTGTLKVYCKDASNETMDLIRIKNPHKVRNLLNELVERDRKSHNVMYGEMQH